jgi:hypothetical protein
MDEFIVGGHTLECLDRNGHITHIRNTAGFFAGSGADTAGYARQRHFLSYYLEGLPVTEFLEHLNVTGYVNVAGAGIHAWGRNVSTIMDRISWYPIADGREKIVSKMSKAVPEELADALADRAFGGVIE